MRPVHRFHWDSAGTSPHVPDDQWPACVEHAARHLAAEGVLVVARKAPDCQPSEDEFRDYVRRSFWNESTREGGWRYDELLAFVRRV